MLFAFFLRNELLGRRPITLGPGAAPKVCAVAKVLFHYDGQAYRCEDEVTAEKVAEVREQLAEMERVAKSVSGDWD